MTSLEAGKGDEVFSFKIKQCYWGSVNLSMKEITNHLVFRHIGISSNPDLTVAFSYNTKEEPKGQEIIFPAHAISQVLYTSKYQSKDRPCVVVLRLTVYGYNQMKMELADYCEQWKDLMQRKLTHWKAFSDNLIFVCEEKGLESKTSDDMYCTQTWETGIEPYFAVICRYWSDYLNARKEIPRQYWVQRSDLSAVLSESNFKNFFTSFGMRMTEFNRGYSSQFIGFKTLPLTHDHTYEGVIPDSDDEREQFITGIGKRTRHLQEFAKKWEAGRPERERQEREEEERKRAEREKNGIKSDGEEETEKVDEDMVQEENEKKDEEDKNNEEDRNDEDVEMADNEKQDKEKQDK
ncbi:unnamed protein product [Caenorhabditis brenneri]